MIKNWLTNHFSICCILPVTVFRCCLLILKITWKLMLVFIEGRNFMLSKFVCLSALWNWALVAERNWTIEYLNSPSLEKCGYVSEKAGTQPLICPSCLDLCAVQKAVGFVDIVHMDFGKHNFQCKQHFTCMFKLIAVMSL